LFSTTWACCCLLLHQDGVVVDKLQGANAPELANKVSKWSTINAVTVPMAAAAAVGGPPTIQEDITKQSVVPAAPPTQSCSIQQIDKQQSETDHNKELAQLINQSPIMLFIKGNPKDPCCGFSRKVVDVLNAAGVKFGSFDVLSDDAVRQGLKEFSNWPTFPQLYVQGELLGGCDIVSEMHQSGELKEVSLMGLFILLW
jgi:Grx4 family monothiol glutaredoxin